MNENEWARTGHVPASSAPSATIAPPPPTHMPPWGSPLPDPPRRRSLTSVVVAASLAGLVGAGLGFGGAYALVDRDQVVPLSSSPTSSPPVTASPGSVAGAALHSDGYRGRARMVVDLDREVVLGVTLVGSDVAETIHAATVAIVGEVPISRLWHAVPAYPTISEVWLRLLEAYGRPTAVVGRGESEV